MLYICFENEMLTVFIKYDNHYWIDYKIISASSK